MTGRQLVGAGAGLALGACLVFLALAWFARSSGPPERLAVPGTRAATMVPTAPSEPRPTPVTAVEVRPGQGETVYDIAWGDAQGGSWRSRIRISPGSRPNAEVSTRAAGEAGEAVRYRAQASTAADGTVTIDGRGQTVHGPLAQDWSPDSFTIATDGSVHIQDERHAPSEGWVVSVSR